MRGLFTAAMTGEDWATKATGVHENDKKLAIANMAVIDVFFIVESVSYWI